jgi:hypothetical protein
MNEAAPAFLVALEASAVGHAIRQSVWIYPSANVLHVVALAMFAGAVAVLDLRLLGAFAATRPADVIYPARRAAVAALVLLVATGAVLFIAEASHVALNPVFQAKALLIAAGVANALIVARLPADDLDRLAAGSPLPRRLRMAAIASLAIWLAVAAAGRLIAYV